MARFTAQAKKGFYKTPTHLVPLIAQYLRCPEPDTVRLLDPCAGEGEALELFGTHLALGKHQLYANELDEPRALACRNRGLTTVCGDAVHELRTLKQGFQCLYLNPPYDYEGDGTGRTEWKFLRTAQFLADSGVLIFIVPLAVLRTRHFVTRLPHYFHSMRVFRFPDADFTAFGQAVLIGLRGKGHVEMETQALQASLQAPPYLGEPDRVWDIPATKPVQSFPFFSENLLDDQIGALMTTQVAQRECDFGLKHSSDRTVRSLMPLRSGHQALLLATGLMDGLFHDPATGNLLVIVGTTEIKENTTIECIHDRDVTRVRKTPTATVTAFDVTASVQSGEITLYTMQ